eukprot:1895248-Rhodomonas_salina.1
MRQGLITALCYRELPSFSQVPPIILIPGYPGYPGTRVPGTRVPGHPASPGYPVPAKEKLIQALEIAP